jgi:hypothetical protein
MTRRPRRNHTPAFKAKVAPAAELKRSSPSTRPRSTLERRIAFGHPSGQTKGKRPGCQGGLLIARRPSQVSARVRRGLDHSDVFCLELANVRRDVSAAVRAQACASWGFTLLAREQFYGAEVPDRIVILILFRALAARSGNVNRLVTHAA